MDNNSSLMGLVAVVAALGTLFGWLLKQIIQYFISKNNEKDIYIKELVSSNQKNTDDFKQTINHNQTKMNASIDRLTLSINEQSGVFKQLIKDDYGRRGRRDSDPPIGS